VAQLLALRAAMQLHIGHPGRLALLSCLALALAPRVTPRRPAPPAGRQPRRRRQRPWPHRPPNDRRANLRTGTRRGPNATPTAPLQPGGLRALLPLSASTPSPAISMTARCRSCQLAPRASPHRPALTGAAIVGAAPNSDYRACRRRLLRGPRGPRCQPERQSQSARSTSVRGSDQISGPPPSASVDRAGHQPDNTIRSLDPTPRRWRDAPTGEGPHAVSVATHGALGGP